MKKLNTPITTVYVEDFSSIEYDNNEKDFK